MASPGRVGVCICVVNLLIVFSTVDAGDFFSHFDGMFDDPFMLMFQNYSTCGRRRIPEMTLDTTSQSDDGMEREVLVGEYPWQAALYHGGMKLCSAVLIHEQWLLTAASCISYLKEPYTVIAGEPSLLESGDDDDALHNQTRTTTKVYVHPRYDARRMEADVALVMVDSAFELNDYVNIICLPYPKMLKNFRPGTNARVAGWGEIPPASVQPGMCPKPTSDIMDECEVERCEADAECSRGEKCCRNGCNIMTCTRAIQQEPRPGVLRGRITPLLNHATCHQTLMGALPKGVICAGATPQWMGAKGSEMMEEGGILSLMKRKKEMELRTDHDGVDKAFDGHVDDETDFQGDIDLIHVMSHLMELIDGSEGGVDDYGQRQSGAWSISKTGKVIRAGKMEDDLGDDDDMAQEMVEEVNDGVLMMINEGMKGNINDRMKEEMKREMIEKKKMLMKAIMKKMCKGDKGSPLVAELEGQWYVLGVSSIPRGCLFRDSPGIYTHLFGLGEWIQPIFNSRRPKQKSMACTVGEFSCGDGWCIPENQRCDGKKDCVLGTDEGSFCDGAMKGFNVYLNHRLEPSTISREFSVTSFAQCAQACLVEPYLCPGFDIVLMPTGSDFMSMHSTDDNYEDDDADEDGTKEDVYDVEDEVGNKIPMLIDGMTMICRLANSTTTVEVRDDVLSVSHMKMIMIGTMPLRTPIPIHFKLPRHAPLAALFSPTTNMYLPTGLIISPSYILGPELATLLEDRSFVLRFIKKLLMEEVVRVSYSLCIVNHPRWDAIRMIEMKIRMMREEAKDMMNMMIVQEEGGGDDMSMAEHQMMVGEIRMQMREMARNFTEVRIEMEEDCDVMEVRKRLEMEIEEKMGNESCEIMSEVGGMVDGGIEGMERDGGQGKPSGMMAILMKMMEELEERMPELLMTNLYPDSDIDPMRRKQGAGEKLMMGLGSMLGDSWSMLGNDDVMSTFLTDKLESIMTMTGPESENYARDLTSSKMIMLKEMAGIISAITMDVCNPGNATFEDSPDGGMDTYWELAKMKGNEEAAGGIMMRVGGLRNRLRVRRRKWFITQSPAQFNTVTFNVLDARGPAMVSGVPKEEIDFGVILARGLKGGVPMAIDAMVSHTMRRMEMMAQKQDGGYWEMYGDIGTMSDFMDDPMVDTEDELSLRTPDNGDDDGMTMEGPFLEDLDDDIFWKVVNFLVESTARSNIDVDVAEHLVEALRRGDIDKATFIHEIGHDHFRRIYVRMMVKLRMVDARGPVFLVDELHRGTSFSVDGSVVDLSQYATNESHHGVIMEYKSDWSCEQKTTKAMGVLTSPNFPGLYPSNVLCSSLISAPPGHVIILFVMSLKLQQSPFCLQDSLTIYDEVNPLNWTRLGQGSFCGTTVPHVFRSSGRNLLLKFSSDNNQVHATNTGFKIAYAFQGDRATTSNENDVGSRSESNIDPTTTHIIKKKLFVLNICIASISGVLLIVLAVNISWIYRMKMRNEKSKDPDVFDTKL